jgi:hypothetical protein
MRRSTSQRTGFKLARFLAACGFMQPPIIFKVTTRKETSEVGTDSKETGHPECNNEKSESAVCGNSESVTFRSNGYRVAKSINAIAASQVSQNR